MDNQRDLVRIETKKNICGYVYASASIDESTTNSVFSGQKLIATNGRILKNNQYDVDFCVTTLDLEELNNYRCKYTYFKNDENNKDYKYLYLNYNSIFNKNTIYDINPYPFIPNENNKEKVLTIQNTNYILKPMSFNTIIL